MGLNAKAIGRKILQARLAKGLTQAQLAKALGVDRGTVGRWETGHAVPRQVSLPKVAAALGQAPETLLAGSEVIDTLTQNEDVLRAEKATLKQIRDQVKRLTEVTYQATETSATPEVAPVLALAVAPAPNLAPAFEPEDRVLAEIVKSWGGASTAARLVAALLVTGDWSYRLKLLNQEIDVDEEVIKSLRRA